MESTLAQNVPMFCLPMGAVIESWNMQCGKPNQLFSTCVLTDAVGTKYYGASLTFYETYTKDLTNHQLHTLSFDEDETMLNDDEQLARKLLFFMNKAICIVSRYPFFGCFKQFLRLLYSISTEIDQQVLPIERYISFLVRLKEIAEKKA